MTTYEDLKKYFKEQDYKVIIAADGETRIHEKMNGEVVERMPAGGVSVVMDTIALASNAIYVTRGRSEEDKQVVDKNGKIAIETPEGSYTLKRLFFSEQEVNDYYFGFSNQTLWPLCHASFEMPLFNPEWYKGYIKVNKLFAEAIEQEVKGKTFIWINDYQLALVPLFLKDLKDVVVSCFWHIPWPTWELFRILPQKNDILWSLLSCDYLAFHRGYQARNFLSTVDREIGVRIDEETHSVCFDRKQMQVQNLPMGIDVDIIKNLARPSVEDTFLYRIIKHILGVGQEPVKSLKPKKELVDKFFEQYDVLLGVDRLDYTKGLVHRLKGIDQFFAKNPKYIGRGMYIGIMAPSRNKIPSYQVLKKEVELLAKEINKKYQINGWKPIHLVYEAFTREDIIDLFTKARLCLVTPLDDGMNLVSKEFVIASSLTKDPGMLILSRFAGSAIDLSEALIINPYDIEAIAQAIKKGLTMSRREKMDRVTSMVALLEDRNVYEWARSFVRNALAASHRKHVY